LKTPLIKALAAILVFNLSANKIFASPSVNPEDTTKKTLLASAGKKAESLVILKEANVEFPEILSGHETQSLDYVEKFSTTRKAYLIRTYQRSKKLFPKAVAILKKYNIPEEFKVLLALESGFNANAVSSAGAVGYWQIMDNVAKEYGLKIATKRKIGKKKSPKASGKKNASKIKTSTADDRKNFNKSTHAAARYLKDRSRNLNNDWLLIAASYNCGVGNVWNAMERSGKTNPTFWDIKQYLPSETRAYVMNFIAMNVVFNNYEKFTKNTLCFKPVTAKASDIIKELPEHFEQSY
jgi:membrane-bound lytic murein transglycosylase D